MKICLVSSEHSPWGGIGHFRRRQAALLTTRHEVTLIHSAAGAGEWGIEVGSGVKEVFVEPSPVLAGLSFSCEAHRRSAAVVEAIESVYGSSGPDLLEACDYRAPGFVALQARAAGHPLLRDTEIRTLLVGSAELIGLHDEISPDREMKVLADLERAQLRLADGITYCGGDTLELYSRYYGDGLPPAVRIREPFERDEEPPTPPARDPEQPLRILYVGRLQRCKGTLDLVEACLEIAPEDWALTLIGADTLTAPMGQSVAATIELMCGEDPRVRLEGAVPNAELQSRWTEFDLLVLPSRFEVWANVAMEAMRAGLPVLATPVGGSAEIVEHGVSGWHSDGVGPAALGRVLTKLVEDRGELERVRASGAVYERFLRLADPEEILASYDALAPRPSSPPAVTPPPAEQLVTGIVPYYRASEYVAEAVGSLLAQTHRNLEVLIVNDGSFVEEDAVLAKLEADPRVRVVTQLNGGESSARNLGALLANGEYLVMLDADNLLEPTFVERALVAFRREPRLAYVTCWLRMIGPDGADMPAGRGYAPLGNGVLRGEVENWDGDTVALLPRELFAEQGFRYAGTMQSDWELYRELRAAGRFGVVVPERLARYRVLPESLSRAYGERLQQHGWDEARARGLLRRTRWVGR
jgi:glycosyltransferase involved in cell wall biosynthesis